MITKRCWIATGLGLLICLALVGAIVKFMISPAPASVLVRDPVPPPPSPIVQSPAIASQTAKLTLSDGRTATFWFAVSGGSLQCSAAVGLDQVLCYRLAPVGDPSPPPDPAPSPAPTPNPVPTPAPLPTPGPSPQATSNLRVLFLYDTAKLIDMRPERQAILASPELRSYLDEHCPVESCCAGGMCPLTVEKTPSYRFLPIHADVSRLAPVWQQTYRAAAGKPAPWILATNEAGHTVIDQPWPASANETLALLRKYGGQ